MRIRANRRAVGRNDSGVSLTEMLISITLLAIVMSMVMTFMTTWSRMYTLDRAATDSTHSASRAMDQLGRVIRSGTEVRVASGGSNKPVFSVAERERMQLAAYIDSPGSTPQPTQFEFRIRTQPDGNRELIETRCPAVASSKPYWTFSSTCKTRLVSRHLNPRVNPEPWLFTYYDNKGDPMVVPASGFTLAQRQSIARVQLHVSVQADITSRANPVVMDSSVGIPNLGIDRVGAGA